MAYEFILTTLGGQLVSELAGVSSKRFAVPLVGMGTSGLTLPGDHDDADFILEGDALLKVYELDEQTGTRTLHAHHLLVSAEEVADATRHTIAATFADPVWTLFRRLIGKTAAGYSAGTSLELVDRSTIIAEMLAATNAEDVSGVRPGRIGASSRTYIEGWHFKPLATAIAELGATLDGPDWRVRPIEYDGGYIGELDVLPSIGTHQDNAIFEFGDGALNATGFRRVVTRENTANRVFSIPADFPIGSVLQRDAARAPGRLLEAIVPSDVTIDELRTGLLDAHLAARKGPTQTITVTPSRALGGRVPRFGVDFHIGDTLPFRATVSRRGQLVKRLNITVRLYAYEVSVDALGAATPSLTVTPAGA